MLVNKSTDHIRPDLNPDPSNPLADPRGVNYFNSISSSEGKDSCNFGLPSDCGNWRSRRDKPQPAAAATLEMTAASVPSSAAASKNSCHVYTNPNYPHSSLDVCAASQQIEIGGLPFFLTSGGVAETSLTNFSRSPVHSPVHSQGQSHGRALFILFNFSKESF